MEDLMTKKSFVVGYKFRYELRPHWREPYYIDITVKNKSASLYWRDEFRDNPDRFLEEG